MQVALADWISYRQFAFLLVKVDIYQTRRQTLYYRIKSEKSSIDSTKHGGGRVKVIVIIISFLENHQQTLVWTLIGYQTISANVIETIYLEKLHYYTILNTPPLFFALIALYSLQVLDPAMEVISERKLQCTPSSVNVAQINNSTKWETILIVDLLFSIAACALGNGRSSIL